MGVGDEPGAQGVGGVAGVVDAGAGDRGGDELVDAASARRSGRGWLPLLTGRSRGPSVVRASCSQSSIAVTGQWLGLPARGTTNSASVPVWLVCR